ncbi:MAG: OprO/OprP family phosphate-selective porin [Muribaculaceae bacterium]|nr:OprO/OprP family phosphate-selective porin [Muribaculaceae bacterium]MDE6753100.1 OprO/OprP family phosphate-selective porin [Muribaculaceae bacterium]
MKRRAFCRFLSAVAIAGISYSPIFAEETDCNSTGLLRLNVSARIDWQINRPFGHTDDSNTGFEGKYLMLRADGEIIPGLTYSWRQRLNKLHSDQPFFDATDWLYVNYATGNWNFEAGKEIVAIGGWEYDRAPMDLYGTSVFWNNIPCYQLGATAGYQIKATDQLSLQATQSPFFTRQNRNLYGYSIRWNGSHSFYKPIWSANLFEYSKGHYINYISLGNRFDFGKWRIEADFMNRAAGHQAFLFKDCSAIGEVSFAPDSRWRIHAKMTYDVNHSGTDADMTVLNGTELTMAGGGVEFYPLLKNRTSLRLHATAYYSWGKNANSADVMQSKTFLGNVGITWDMNLLNIKRKH